MKHSESGPLDPNQAERTRNNQTASVKKRNTHSKQIIADTTGFCKCSASSSPLSTLGQAPGKKLQPEASDAPEARLLSEFRHSGGATLYKTIDHCFRQSGFTLTQLKRSENLAIFKQAKPQQSPAFELVVIRRRKASIAFGREFPATEYYPRAEDFGTFGFTYRSLEEAEWKFEELLCHAKNGRAQ
jgi:hypothetical protein